MIYNKKWMKLITHQAHWFFLLEQKCRLKTQKIPREAKEICAHSALFNDFLTQNYFKNLKVTKPMSNPNFKNHI